jgi:hypothetical protein
MLHAWMRLGRAVRPWIVAVALATGALAGYSCGGSGAEDVPGTEYGAPTCYRDDDCTDLWFGPEAYCGPGGWCLPGPRPDADADADVPDDARRDDASDDGFTPEVGMPSCTTDEDCVRLLGPDYICEEEGWYCRWGGGADADVAGDEWFGDGEEEADVPVDVGDDEDAEGAVEDGSDGAD